MKLQKLAITGIVTIGAFVLIPMTAFADTETTESQILTFSAEINEENFSLIEDYTEAGGEGTSCIREDAAVDDSNAAEDYLRVVNSKEVEAKDEGQLEKSETELEGQTEVGGKAEIKGETEAEDKTHVDGEAETEGKTDANDGTEIEAETEVEGNTNSDAKTEAGINKSGDFSELKDDVKESTEVSGVGDISGCRIEAQKLVATCDEYSGVKVYDGNNLLVEGTDYTVTTSLDGNILTATCEGRGKYRGALSASIKIASAMDAGNTLYHFALSDGRVMAVDGTSVNSGANIKVEGCTNTVGELFYLNEVRTGIYAIINAATGKAVDVYCGRSAKGTNIWQYDPNGTKAQEWMFFLRLDGFYEITGRLAADGENGLSANGNNVYQGDVDTLWKLIKAGELDEGLSGPYTIRTIINGVSRCLDVSGASTANCANVQLYDRNATNAQKWTFKKIGKGLYNIVCACSGKVLDVSGASTANSANAWQYASNGTKAQQWRAIKNLDGTYTFACLCSGKVLDIAGALNIRGRNVAQYQSNNTIAQKFELVSTAGETRSGVYSEVFLSYVRQVGLMADANNWKYGDSHAVPPCADGLIACDRLVARALYDMGYTNQPKGGITINTYDYYKTFENYLLGYGLKKSTNYQLIRLGSIVVIKRPSWYHAYVAADYCTDGEIMPAKYDAGSQERLDEKCGLYFTGEALGELFAVYNF